VWYAVTASCNACHEGSSTNGATGQAACTCSNSMLIWTLNGCVDRYPCAAGQYKTEREREIMLFIGKPMGRSIMISNTSIHATCQTCPAQSTSPAGSGTCSVSVSKCNAGYYKISDGASCTMCPSHSTSSAGSSDLSVNSCICNTTAGYMACAANTGTSDCPVQSQTVSTVAHCTCRPGYYTENNTLIVSQHITDCGEMTTGPIRHLPLRTRPS